jgi:hypothetical protein
MWLHLQLPPLVVFLYYHLAEHTQLLLFLAFYIDNCIMGSQLRAGAAGSASDEKLLSIEGGNGLHTVTLH